MLNSVALLQISTALNEVTIRDVLLSLSIEVPVPMHFSLQVIPLKLIGLLKCRNAYWGRIGLFPHHA